VDRLPACLEPINPDIITEASDVRLIFLCIRQESLSEWYCSCRPCDKFQRSKLVQEHLVRHGMII
jgi:hypothetical protein